MGVPSITGKAPDKLAEIKDYFNGRFRDALEGVPEELMLIQPEELETAIRPTQNDWLLRHRFWNLIELAEMMNLDEISTTRIYSGICCQGYFYQRWLMDQRRLAWLMNPIAREKLINQEIYHVLSKKVRDYVLDLQVTDDNIDSVSKLLKQTSERAFGPPVQRIQTQNTNIEIPAPPGSGERPVGHEEIRAEIKRLESLVEKSPEVTIDVAEEDQ